jgi:hypothetical protein
MPATETMLARIDTLEAIVDGEVHLALNQKADAERVQAALEDKLDCVDAEAILVEMQVLRDSTNQKLDALVRSATARDPAPGPCTCTVLDPQLFCEGLWFWRYGAGNSTARRKEKGRQIMNTWPEHFVWDDSGTVGVSGGGLHMVFQGSSAQGSNPPPHVDQRSRGFRVSEASTSSIEAGVVASGQALVQVSVNGKVALDVYHCSAFAQEGSNCTGPSRTDFLRLPLGAAVRLRMLGGAPGFAFLHLRRLG